MAGRTARVDVIHNEAAQRFEAAVKGGLAVAAYRSDGDVITLTDTEVPSEATGGGVGNALARAALDYARAHRFRVVPRCPFMAAFIQRHAEYQDLLASR